MPRVQFVGQSARDSDNQQGNTSRLVNLYREPIGVGGKSTHALKSVLGTSLLVDTGEILARDMVEAGGRLYALNGGTLFDVRSGGEINTLATVSSAAGSMLFGAELGKVGVVSDGRYYVWNGTAISEPTAGAFSSIGSGAFVGGYSVLTEKDGRRFLWSDLADSTTLPGLNFATAESTDGNVLRVMPLQGRMWVMKTDAIEQWYITGQAGANAFTRLSGGVLEVGLKAAGLVSQFTGGLFFIGSDDIAYISNGGQLQPISPPAVNTAIAQGDPTECFTYEDEGHKFCVIRFDDRPAWVYDIVTGEWHERASGQGDAWGLRGTTYAFGAWRGFDNSGRIYTFSRNNEDAGSPLIRTATSSTLYNEGRKFRVPLLEFTGRMGRGVAEAGGDVWTIVYPDGREFFNADDGETVPDEATWTVEHTYVREPALLLRTSRDGGNTWGRHIVRDLGAIGEYGQLCRVRNLGSFIQVACEISMAAPQEITLDASVNVVIA